MRSSFSSSKQAEKDCSRPDILKLIRDGDIETREKLLINSENVNQTNWSGWAPLHRASELGRMDFIQLLMEYGGKFLA